MIYDLRDTAGKCGIGMLGSMLASVTAGQEQIAWGVGVMVATASFISVCIDIVKKLKRKK